MRAALCLFLLAAIPPAASRAQGSGEVSDVLILIQDIGAENLISITFAKPTAQSKAKALLQALAKRGGWTLGRVEISDESVEDFGNPGKMVTQTGISSTIAGEPLTSEGGYRLQPFVDVFADYGRLEVLFLDDEDKSFAGLRTFESPAVKVDLIKAGSPYRYLVRIDKSAGPIPRIPLVQALSPAPPPPKVESPQPAPERNPLPFVLIVSAASGLAVFVSLMLLSHLRSRRVSRPQSRRPSRP